MKVRVRFDPESTDVKYQSMAASLITSVVHFSVFESRRHSQCSHICPQCPTSCPGMSLSLTLKCLCVERRLVSVLISPLCAFRSEMCRWGRWSRCHSSDTGSCRRSRQTAAMVTPLATSAGQKGGREGGLKQINYSCVGSAGTWSKEGRSLKEACARKWRAWTVKPLRNHILLNAATCFFFCESLSPNELTPHYSRNKRQKERVAAVLMWSSAGPSLQREEYAIDCTCLFLFCFL